MDEFFGSSFLFVVDVQQLKISARRERIDDRRLVEVALEIGQIEHRICNREAKQATNVQWSIGRRSKLEVNLFECILSNRIIVVLVVADAALGDNIDQGQCGCLHDIQ